MISNTEACSLAHALAHRTIYNFQVSWGNIPGLYLTMCLWNAWCDTGGLWKVGNLGEQGINIWTAVYVVCFWRFTYFDKRCCGVGVTAWQMKALCSFKMLETTHLTTQYHIPEDWNSQKHCCEDLKCHIIFLPCETAGGRTVAQVVTCWLLLCSVLSNFMWDSWWMERKNHFINFILFPSCCRSSLLISHFPLKCAVALTRQHTPVFQWGALCLIWHFANLSVRNS
jgi:hypothetical protein